MMNTNHKNKLKDRLTTTTENAKTGQDIMAKIAKSKVGQKVYVPLITTMFVMEVVVVNGGGWRRWWGGA